MEDSRDLGSGLEDPERPSRRSVLQTAATLGLGATVGTGIGSAQNNRIEYGDTVSGTTDERWTFEAEEGDEVSIEVRPDDPVDNSAEIELVDPSGDVEEHAGSTGEDGNSVITLYEIERGQGGEYTIVASGDGSFGYELSLYEGVPIDATIEYGDTVESEFTRDNRYYEYGMFSGYHETYAFKAAEGDEISIEVRPADPVNNAAEITLMDPNGEYVEEVGPNGEDGNAVITLYEVDRSQGGEYTIVASGDEMTDLFEYELHLYEGVPIDETIEYGDTVESEFTRDNRYYEYGMFSGYHETYAFEAEEGDEVSVEVRPTDSVNNAAEITLIDPAGEYVEEVGPNGEDGNAVITLYEVDRGQGGEYTIVASGDEMTDLFEYELSLYEGVPVDATIEYGDTVESEFTRDNRYYEYGMFSGYHETYAFEAEEGDEIGVEVRPADPVDEAAEITLIDPNGEYVEEVGPNGENGNAVITGYAVESGQGGEYTIVASGDEMTDLFEYELELILENRAEQTESATPTETATQTQSPTPTRAATQTEPATQTESATPTERETPTQSDAPAETDETSGSGPGFGVGGAILGLGGAGYALKRNAGSEEDES
jgi:PGF-CTERM protein